MRILRFVEGIDMDNLKKDKDGFIDIVDDEGVLIYVDDCGVLAVHVIDSHNRKSVLDFRIDVKNLVRKL